MEMARAWARAWAWAAAAALLAMAAAAALPLLASQAWACSIDAVQLQLSMMSYCHARLQPPAHFEAV